MQLKFNLLCTIAMHILFGISAVLNWLKLSAGQGFINFFTPMCSTLNIQGNLLGSTFTFSSTAEPEK